MLDGLFHQAIELQQAIYVSVQQRISAFAETGDWSNLATFLPTVLVLGAVHAATPGHNKTVLATYFVGSRSGLGRSIAISFVMSLTHVATAVIIVLLAIPVVRITLGAAGETPFLMYLSRSALIAFGFWLIYRGFRPKRADSHSAGEGWLVGFASGLVPCPLTLFAMSYAVVKGVTVAGLAFAATMMVGILATTSLVALAAVGAGQHADYLLGERAARRMRYVQIAAGVLLIAISLSELG